MLFGDADEIEVVDDENEDKDIFDLLDELVTETIGSSDGPILPYFSDFLDEDSEMSFRGPRRFIRARIESRKKFNDESEKIYEDIDLRNRFIFDGSAIDSLSPSRKEKKLERSRVKRNKANDEKITQITESTDLYY